MNKIFNHKLITSYISAAQCTSPCRIRKGRYCFEAHKKAYNCNLCRSISHQLKYVYMCFECKQTFCLQHFCTHLTIFRRTMASEYSIFCERTLVIDNSLSQELSYRKIKKLFSHCLSNSIKLTNINSIDIEQASLLWKRLISIGDQKILGILLKRNIQ